MEAFTYKGIADGKYVTGDIEAINLGAATGGKQKPWIQFRMCSGAEKALEAIKSGTVLAKGAYLLLVSMINMTIMLILLRLKTIKHFLP